MFETGDILSFNYLWARQADQGEESGRKARPVCLTIRGVSQPAWLYLLPITSQQPATGKATLPIAEIECVRAGLDFPCWIILDEMNRTREDKAYDIAAQARIGRFSRAFMDKITGELERGIRARRLRVIDRNAGDR